MRSQLSHDYKFLEGLLHWLFGNQVDFAYRYEENGPEEPVVLINGRNPFKGRFKTDDLVRYLEEMGLERLDWAD